MKSWKRGGDRDLEAQLRAARPEPRPELTQAIADRMRSSRSSGFLQAVSRVPLGLAGGLTAVFLAVVIALGGGSYPLDAARDALNLQNTAHETPPPTRDQYDTNVSVCKNGQTILVPAQEARRLVASGEATRGPCRRPRPNPRP